MELSFTHKTAAVYRELSRPVRRIQETAESVVPDTDEDIGRIVSVRTTLLLKSKDLTSRGVLITGEIRLALLYITETEQSVACVNLKKDFEMDFDLGPAQDDILTQIRLSVGSTEARILNPRKVAVTVELLGELSCYRQEEQRLETLLPETAAGLLHVRREETQTTAVNAVCEKSFAINEQFRFPEGKPAPERLVSQELSFTADNVQQVGSRAIVKGQLFVDVCYLSQEAEYPLYTRFSAPFSQIVDTGAEVSDGCGIHMELTGAFFELIDTIGGEKALDAELHALLELVSRQSLPVSYLSDAYSNRMPVQTSFQPGTLQSVFEVKTLTLGSECEIAIAEDCEDVLFVLPSPCQTVVAGEELSAIVALDVLYRTKDGTIAAVRRPLETEKAALPADSRVSAQRLVSLDLRPEGHALRCRAEAAIELQRLESHEIAELSGVTLLEDEAWDPDSFPTVTLAAVGGASLWELAKRFHSSEAAIRALNDEERLASGKPLLIPRE